MLVEFQKMASILDCSPEVFKDHALTEGETQEYIMLKISLDDYISIFMKCLNRKDGILPDNIFKRMGFERLNDGRFYRDCVVYGKVRK